MQLKPIVEGRGEVTAIPKLLGRLFGAAQVTNIHVGSCIQIKRDRFDKAWDLQKWLHEVKLLGAQGALIIYDADDDCPGVAADRTRLALSEYNGPVRYQVAVANKEFEAWFLAALPSLRGIQGIWLRPWLT